MQGLSCSDVHDILEISGHGRNCSCCMLVQARAAILVRTLSLVNGNSRVRLSVVEAFINVLNCGTTPQLRGASYDRDVLQQLANSLAGEGIALHQQIQPHDCCILSPTNLPLLTQPRFAGKQQPFMFLDMGAGLEGAALPESPGVSAEERTVLEAGQSASAGIAALVVAAGRSTVSAASAVAALSSEALQAQV